MKHIKKNTFKKRRKVCYFTENNFTKIDFKDIELLQRFLTDRGRIMSRRITNTSAKWQRHLAIAIKRARHMALIPFVQQ
ncbi:30S ribosomal protein S18 ['Fragaria x ananassa' phyllody phytoplasma]|uniref:Small ribosomal subunit protein bS18 n=1 Tax='Fragaria x ananassa' phyllody phytoplasma TaxID=2358428 RepID=A0ABS5K2M0_9MOLU|nr:30S ribosomal protein S18 ['Fragaria x ananassa' phyllody phytoplasma]MBS2126121.1 30S ribosomal protein S18 ['Fragaria x ananassa' phyllody phytoplasma]